ncbi:MAG: ComEC/Rec2 family competence protein [Saprospiraceae bacterium]|uniref:ComEC/Rec2 family competence protein n=1 Tax=Candidatus Opimibacter skivensis TaxID=2982028 RepID=A0A9D7SU65_9BACT|nr:ComEC/Rec2 family competence protein [Candidatus Opimibacter skivensis]
MRLYGSDRSDMDNDVRRCICRFRSYACAIRSGMHVAIFTACFSFSWAPVQEFFLNESCDLVRIQLRSYFMLVLAGACPAVVRAGLMIILHLFGKAMGLNTQVWNLLGFWPSL